MRLQRIARSDPTTTSAANLCAAAHKYAVENDWSGPRPNVGRQKF